MVTAARRGALVGIVLSAVLAGGVDAQQTFPPNKLRFFTQAPPAGLRADVFADVETSVGALRIVRVSARRDGQIVVPRRAWGRTVGEVHLNNGRGVPLKLPRRPRGTIVLRASAPRVELVPTRRTHDLRLSRFPADTRVVNLVFSRSPGGPLLRSRTKCPRTAVFRAVVVRTIESPAVSTQTDDTRNC